jgi:hypothetical protein
MSPQADYVVSNGTGAAVRSDINNQLAAIVSNNSGATEPATMYAYQWWADTTTGLLKIRNAANNAWVTVGTLASTNLGLLASGGTLVSALGSASTPGITFTGDLNTGIYSPGADQVSIATGGSDRLSVDASGNVTINAQGDLRFADSDSSNWVAFQAPGTVASNVTWTLPSADGTSGQALTTNGSGTLSWASAAAAKISVGNTEAEVVDTGVDGHFKVTTEGTERARIDSSGRLLVGTSTSPSAGNGSYSNLVVGGQPGASTSYGNIAIVRNQAASALVTNSGIGGVSFCDNTGGTFADILCQADATPGSNDFPGRLVFSTTADGASSPTERMRIAQDGVITAQGVYDFTTANAANVAVLSAGQIYRSTSSSKYKTDIETLENAYSEALLECRPVWYRSTCESDNPSHSWWGFIAEEVAAIDPRLVHWKTVQVNYDEKGSAVETPCDPEPEGVAYDRFVPHLLNLVKRQKEQIEAMEARLSALEAS